MHALLFAILFCHEYSLITDYLKLNNNQSLNEDSSNTSNFDSPVINIIIPMLTNTTLNSQVVNGLSYFV